MAQKFVISIQASLASIPLRDEFESRSGGSWSCSEADMFYKTAIDFVWFNMLGTSSVFYLEEIGFIEGSYMEDQV